MKIEFAKKNFKNNFIGPEELKSIESKVNFDFPKKIPNINLNLSNINPDEYILIYGCSRFHNKTKFDIKKLIEIFGYNYTKDTVCFYNQDWYSSEKFINNTPTFEDNTPILNNKPIIVESKSAPKKFKIFDPSLNIK